MKTTLRVTVKNAGFWTRIRSYLFWFLHIFDKSTIQVWIDDPESSPIVLKARNAAYTIDLTPGSHTVFFDDPLRAKRMKLSNLGTNLILGSFAAGVGAGANGIPGAVFASTVLADSGSRSIVRDNVLCCDLNPGDEISVVVKPLMKKVKVTLGS